MGFVFFFFFYLSDFQSDCDDQKCVTQTKQKQFPVSQEESNA